jgi:DNA mismatch repair ATPase MutS
VELGAIGAVTSHDLQLADAPRLSELAIAVHFREDVVETPAGPRMHFDYRLRPGIATTRNALRLMAEMGLPVHELDRNGGLER